MKKSIILGMLMLGCGGKAFDLGHTESEPQGFADLPEADGDAGGADPQTLYRSTTELVSAFTLDETNVYAIITHADSYELISCPIERCRTARTTLYSAPYPHPPGNGYLNLIVVGETLFWTTDEYLVASCSKHGCDQPLVTNSVVQVLAGDDEYAYWLDGANFMRLAPGSATPELVRRDEAHLFGGPLYVSTSSVYFTSVRSDGIYRMAKDGQTDAELFASDQDIADISVNRDALFYTSNILTGRVVRCELDDCGAGTSRVAAVQRWPSEVHATESELFWLNEVTSSSRGTKGSLASCALPACDSVRQWGLDFTIESSSPKLNSVAVNDRYVVYVESVENGSVLRAVSR